MTHLNDTSDGENHENEQPNTIHSALLDDFINARHANQPDLTPRLEEAQLAEDLMALADKMHLPESFHADMHAQFAAQRAKPQAESHHRPDPKRLIQFPYVNVYARGRKPANRIPFTLVAATIIMVAIVVVLFSLPPTEETAQVVEGNFLPNELPLPVGAYIERVSPSTYDLMAETGMTWTAYSLLFSSADANADLNRAQEMIENAHERGLRIMIRVTGTAVELERMGDGYFPMFATFLGEIARFHPDAIQVWHQPNIDRVWFQNNVNASTYLEMLRQAYDAIKRVDQNVMVISAAPAPTGVASAYPSQVINDDIFYEEMARAGVANYVDCIGVTYVEGTVPPDQLSGDQRDNYATRYFVLMLRRASEAFENQNLPLCITQIGYNAPEEFTEQLTPAFRWAQANTLFEQAEWLREAIVIAADFENMPIAMFLIWNMHYSQYDSPVNGYALIRPNETCLACETIATLRDTKE